MVFGCGVLGVLVTMLARAAGIYVIAVDPSLTVATWPVRLVRSRC